MGLFDRLFGPPSKDKFAKLMVTRIRRAGENQNVIYDAAQFRLLRESQDGSILFLGNAYQEYCAATKEKREEILRRWARSWFLHQREIPEEFEDIRPDLFPVLRPRSYYELIRLRLTIEGKEPAGWQYQTIGDHFALGLVYDQREWLLSVSNDHLNEWGVTFYEAMETARENLVAMEHPFASIKKDGGLYLSASGDNFDASRIILHELLRKFNVEGDYVAVAPNRDTLILTGSEDRHGLQAMVAMAKKALEEPRFMSGIAMKLEGDEWVPWLPSQSHPLYKEFKMLQLQSLGQEYCDQKELLDKLHVTKGEDIFVASYNGVEDKEANAVYSYSVWAEGVPTLLPQSDRIALVRNGSDEPLMLDWDHVVAVAGDLMEPVDIYPPRWQVTEFPNREQWKAMGGL